MSLADKSVNLFYNTQFHFMQGESLCSQGRK